VEPTFSIATFRRLVRAGIDNEYSFVTFEEAPAAKAARVCALRHDVDSDPGAALTLAEVEADEGVRATYFVMLRSPVYNLFLRANQQLVEEIVALGHAIGLHYDPGFEPRRGRSHTEQITTERRALEELLGLPVSSVAFHQPSLVPGASEIEVEHAVKANGLAGFHFLADPNQSRQVFDAFEVFRTGEPSKLQLLIHPMWWVGGHDLTPPELWERSIEAEWERSQEQLLIERAYGPPRRLTLEPEPAARAVDGTG
jgi:hypothetical protein